jgi:hypothetical protein
MSKYDPLYKWLRLAKGNKVSVTFQRIEEILGFPLPASAREHRPWWANEANISSKHVHCKAWLDAGFETTNVDLIRGTVDFRKMP